MQSNLMLRGDRSGPSRPQPIIAAYAPKGCTQKHVSEVPLRLLYACIVP